LHGNPFLATGPSKISVGSGERQVIY